MAMTLAQIYTHVRDTVDLDSTELPDAYLAVLCTEATNDIASRQRYWPLYQQVPYTLATVANQHEYQISVLEPASTDTAEIVTIVDQTNGGYSMPRVDHATAENSFRNSLDTASVPMVWSQWAGYIYLWPKPTGVRTLKVRAYRKPIDWVALGAATTPDLDERLHVAVPLYALIRVYEQQEEPQLAGQYRELYEMYVSKIVREIFRMPEGPIVLNGGMKWPSMSETAWIQNMVDV